MSRILEPVSDKDAQQLPDNQKQPPPGITGDCQSCGECCSFYNCAIVDDETGRCPIYKNRPVACRIWPNRQCDINAVGCPGFHQTGL